MATLKELRQVRIGKLEQLKKLGVDPYPAKSAKSIHNSEILNHFDKYEGKKVTAAGRVMSIRRHGGLTFFDIKDSTGNIQFYIKQENIEKPNYAKSELGYDDLDLFDMGDFAEAVGRVVKTKAGQISVEVEKIRILTKTLRPLPDKWEGLKDKETRLRRRYIDTVINHDVYERFVRRARFWEAHREFFKKHGFLEINIPVLEAIPGGADANPFITHMDAIDQDFYLRISHELYLKRLIGGGYEKVYEIGPRFRNEGLSDEHLPEHMAMEFYWAYADWEEGMDFVEKLFNYVIEQVYGDKKTFEIRGHKVTFSKKWERIDFAEVMREKYDIDVHNTTLEEVNKTLRKHHVKGDFGNNVSRGIDNLWKNLRKEISGPAFLINHPKFLSPLSKSKFDMPHITERFQPIIAGSELGNGWSELNDPLDQLERFKIQQDLRDSGDAEAQFLDIDYVEMLEYGMPPTFGWGHSERVFWFLEDVTAREGVPFPQLKHELEETTVEIYGADFLKVARDVKRDTKIDTKVDAVTDKGRDAGKDVKSAPAGNAGKGKLPTRQEAWELLKKNVKDDYQRLHAEMVAAALEAYAQKLGYDSDLWYITGLLHDLDYFEYPDEHPRKELEWFREWGYPEELIHAVEAHARSILGTEPQSVLASAILATDELCGFLYAYSLMRPEGFEGMKTSSATKKFKERSFAAKVDRDEIIAGVDAFSPVISGLEEHITFLIEVFKNFSSKES